MKKSFWNKRIPTYFGLVLLTASMVVITFLGKNFIEFRGRASTDEAPKNVRISNITSSSFVVSFTTDTKTQTSISYGSSDQLGPPVFDDRDKDNGVSTERHLHYITVNNLIPETKYFFIIQSGAQAFFNDNAPYETTTGSIIEAGIISDQQPLRGETNLPDGNIPLEGIVYVSATTESVSQNSQLLSGLLRQDGSYEIPLETLKADDLKSYFAFAPDTALSVLIINANLESRAIMLANAANPAPIITLSRDYDFRAQTTLQEEGIDLLESDTASPSGDSQREDRIVTFPIFSTHIASGPAILSPEEGQKFIDQQPLFEGTALPNSTVDIIITSDNQIIATVQADFLGNWQFRPSVPIDPGEHVIAIIARDTEGVLKTIRRSFTVHAQGSQFNEPSVSPTEDPLPTTTPTAQPTPTTIETPTPEPTFTIAPTQIPTLFPSPNLTLTAAATTPTIDPESLAATMRAAGASMPPSGNAYLLIAGFVVIVSVIGSFMLFFF